MKVDVEIVEILAAYDLTGTLRAAAELTGCSHHTVARHVAARDAPTDRRTCLSGPCHGPVLAND